MSRFTVVWQSDAEDDVASIWLSASDRTAVTAATNAIDLELADDPSSKGADVREGLRALDVPPLRAFYDVDEGDRKVEVQCVRLLAD